MGYINDFEQQQILTLYGRRAEYRCDECGAPIYVEELMVVDKKAGYLPHKNTRPNFLPSRHPKVTYHRRCDDVRRGKRPKFDSEKVVESAGSKVEKIAKRVLEAIANKPKNNYWDVGKVLGLFPGAKAKDKKLIRQVVRDLRAHGKLVRKKSHLYLPKKGKKK